MDVSEARSSLARRASWMSDFDGDHGFNGLTGSEGVLRLGALVAGSQGDQPVATFGLMPQGTTKRNWGSQWKAAAVQWYDRRTQVSLVGEHLSWRQNYRDLDPTYTDRFGDPLLRFTLDWTDHEHRQRELGSQIARRIAPLMGGTIDDTKPSRSPYTVTCIRARTSRVVR